MNISKFSPWIITVFSIQASMILYFENSSLKKENRICQTEGDILRDQLMDLNSSLTNLVGERDYVATKSYVLGATQAIKQPEKFGELWHDGYNRGLQQTIYASEHSEEKNQY